MPLKEPKKLSASSATGGAVLNPTQLKWGAYARRDGVKCDSEKLIPELQASALHSAWMHQAVIGRSSCAMAVSNELLMSSGGGTPECFNGCSHMQKQARCNCWEMV